jgi:hypothetical protein
MREGGGEEAVGSRSELDVVTGTGSIGGSNGALEERRKRKKME